MSMIARKPNEKIQNRYRLNDNFKEGGDSIFIEGMCFKKGMWEVIDSTSAKKLRTFIKSFENPSGILDEYIYDPLKEFKMKENGNPIKFVHRKKQYTRDILVTLQRRELEEIAKEYLIETKGKVTNFLINCIMDEQKKFKTSLSKDDDFFNDNNKIEKEV